MAEKEMVIRGFAARLSAFVLLLVVSQVVASVAFPVELPAEIVHLDQALEDGADILYFGDSTLAYPLGEVTTGEILQEMLPDRSVGEVSHPAYGLDLYLRYIQYVVRSGYQPQTIIVPVNMRSFSPEWDRRPGYQFEKEKKVLALGPFLSRILVRPLGILGAFEPTISQEAFLNTVVYDGDKPVGTVRDFEGLAADEVAADLGGDGGFAYHDALPAEDDQEALQQALIYYYMYRLEGAHRKLQAMLDIARLCEDNDIDVVFYISAVNYQQGERVLGDAFGERLAENIDVVKSALRTEGGERVTLLDLAFGLEAYAFVDMEHLHETGKTYVAGQLVAAMQPEELVKPAPASTATRTSTGVVSTPSVVVLAQDTPTLSSGTVAPPTRAATVPPTESVGPTEGVGPTVFPALSPTASAIETSGLPVSATAVAVATPTSLVPFEIIEDTGPRPGTVTEARYVAHFEPEGKYSVDMVRLRFRTTDERGELVEVRADLYLPSVPVTSSFPVLAYAAGTTGLGDGCAPLDEQVKQRNWGNYQGHSLAYAAQGYIVILANWLGFDDPDRMHPYFVAELQAHVLLDAARAAYDFSGPWLEGDQGDVVYPTTVYLAQPSRAVFFMGYSSGGHAIFAAKDYAIRYAPELVVKGIIGHGPTTNVETLMREDAVFGPYIVHAYRDFYGSDVIDPADVFAPRWVNTFETDVMTKCVDDIFEYYSRSARDMYAPGFRSVLYGGTLAQEFPLFAEKLEENYAGVSGGRHIPVLILQGTGDMVVTPPSQKKFMGQLCAMGTDVTYMEYPAVPHTQIRWVSFSDTLAWMRNIADGGVPRSDCEEGLEP